MSRSTSILLLGGTRPEADRLRRTLTRHFLLVEHARDCGEAATLASRCRFDVLVWINPRDAHWEAMQQMLDEHAGLPQRRLLLVARDRAAMAVEALRAGAADVLLRPCRTDQLVASLTAAGSARVHPPHGRVATSAATLLGETPAIRAIRALLAPLAATAATILVEGEAGTGKALLARLLHEQSGRDGPFVRFDCGAITPDALDRELFGDGRGARQRTEGRTPGPFARAQEGTLLLSGIDALPVELQAKLLTVLREAGPPPRGADPGKPADCRIVVTTRSSLAERVAQSRFREDLFHCLNGIRLTLPPLRERPEDIPLLVSHFAQRAAIDAGLAPVDFDGAMLEALRSHAWPGNVRELEGVVAQAVLLGKLPEAVPEIPATQIDAPEYPRDWTLEQVKQHHMRRVLDACGGNRSAAARRLAISRKTLERKLGNNGD